MCNINKKNLKTQNNKFQADSNILAYQEVGWGNCLTVAYTYTVVPPALCESEGQIKNANNKLPKNFTNPSNCVQITFLA